MHVDAVNRMFSRKIVVGSVGGKQGGGAYVTDLGRSLAAAFRRAELRAQQATDEEFVFAGWYRALGFQGCSSHSGRRTFITGAARKISTVGGSLRDVQMLAGHAALSTTQRYIEADVEAQRKVVDLI